MILVAPYETSNTWFPLMVPWIRGERFDIPEWNDALTQAKGLIREGPWIRGARLVAWMLIKPDSQPGAIARDPYLSYYRVPPSFIKTNSRLF